MAPQEVRPAPTGTAAVQGAVAWGAASGSGTAAKEPVPVLGTDATAAFRLTGSAVGDARMERVPVPPEAGQPFTQAIRIRTEKQPAQEYHLQLQARNVTPVEKGDVLLATFWVRGVDASAETAEARTSLVFELAAAPNTKSLTLPVGAPVGQGWQQVQMPFQLAERYEPGAAQVLFRLGYRPQTIEIGGVSLVNYGKSAQIKELPRTSLGYAGREADAPWRAAARERIERLRKGNLAVLVADAAGWPVPGASVKVAMRRHAFGFGSAVAAAQLVAQTADGQRYRDTIVRLFSKVVLENDLK